VTSYARQKEGNVGIPITLIMHAIVKDSNWYNTVQCNRHQQCMRPVQFTDSSTVNMILWTALLHASHMDSSSCSTSGVGHDAKDFKVLCYEVNTQLGLQPNKSNPT